MRANWSRLINGDAKTVNSYMDIHSHILPEIDDGSSSWEETMDMLEVAYKEGIHIIIATPHYGLFNSDFDLSKARKLVDEANHRLEEQSIKIKIFLGNEIYYVPGIVKDVVAGRVATMAGSSYVLIEFSEDVKYKTVEAAVREFTREGYRPIIAHIERYRGIRDKQLEKISELRQMGAYIQVNTSNFLKTERNGFLRKDNRKMFVESMLEKDMIDFVASDAHDACSRVPVMKSAVDIIGNMVSDEQLNRLFYYNMLALARNEYIER